MVLSGISDGPKVEIPALGSFLGNTVEEKHDKYYGIVILLL
jgi:hypothetical protein